MNKKIFLGLIVLGCGVFISSQSLAQSWVVSKDVQKVANKKSFEDKELMKSHIQAMSVSQNWVVSKGVNSIGRAETSVAGNIRSTGNTDWIIGKGVQQIKRKKSVTEREDPFKLGPEITREGR
ncbi:MAG TPA: hypothetical protein VK589_10605 [Chryseolinea sp.]|nr:hypothetical protein [Chryseolinea sp.]